MSYPQVPIMTTLKELQARYPYQFAGPLISMNVTRGWLALFVQLCEDVDQTLGPDKRGFHWRQIKEKFGQARIYYQLGTVEDHDDEDDGSSQQFEGRAELLQQLLKLKMAMESASAHICAACGEPGYVSSHSGYMLALCDRHHSQREAGERFSIWVEE
jgi:hypothetical protein